MADDIETRLTSNPSDFLEKMSKILVLVVKKTIPMHFYDENGHIVTDENRVFEKWKLDFENLYTQAIWKRNIYNLKFWMKDQTYSISTLYSLILY